MCRQTNGSISGYREATLWKCPSKRKECWQKAWNMSLWYANIFFLNSKNINTKTNSDIPNFVNFLLKVCLVLESTNTLINFLSVCPYFVCRNGMSETWELLSCYLRQSCSFFWRFLWFFSVYINSFFVVMSFSYIGYKCFGPSRFGGVAGFFVFSL